MTYRDSQNEEAIRQKRQLRVATGQLHGIQHALHRVMEEERRLLKEMGLTWMQEAWLEDKWDRFHQRFEHKDKKEAQEAARQAFIRQNEERIKAVKLDDVAARRERRERLGLGEYEVDHTSPESIGSQGGPTTGE